MIRMLVKPTAGAVVVTLTVGAFSVIGEAKARPADPWGHQEIELAPLTTATSGPLSYVSIWSAPPTPVGEVADMIITRPGFVGGESSTNVSSASAI